MKKTQSAKARCRCGSGRGYAQCCRPFHRGERSAPSPERLFKTRYCAYALGDVDYILATTDPEGSAFEADEAAWRRGAEAFHEGTAFKGAKVRSRRVDGDEGWVTYRVTLERGGRDVSFSEAGYFRRVDGRWLYWGTDPETL